MAALNVALPNPGERVACILIVEDEPLVRMVLSDYLQECGFRVLEASNANEAMKIIDQSSVTIDLVFSDVVMPGSTDGFGLARWVRASRPGLPFILTSGDAKKVEYAKELCEGQPFMAKPYDLKAIVARIRKTLGQAEGS